jgi:hypothetical protein
MMRGIGLLAALLCSACSTLALTVEAPRNLNGDRPVRMLVRAVERGEFLSDSYQHVSDKVVSKDESVLLSKPIYPGYIHSANVKKPDGKNIAVYFFFTSAGGEWKALLESPLPYSARIVLGAETIRSVQRLY